MWLCICSTKSWPMGRISQLITKAKNLRFILMIAWLSLTLLELLVHPKELWFLIKISAPSWLPKSTTQIHAFHLMMSRYHTYPYLIFFKESSTMLCGIKELGSSISLEMCKSWRMTFLSSGLLSSWVSQDCFQDFMMSWSRNSVNFKALPKQLSNMLWVPSYKILKKMVHTSIEYMTEFSLQRQRKL